MESLEKTPPGRFPMLFKLIYLQNDDSSENKNENGWTLLWDKQQT